MSLRLLKSRLASGVGYFRCTRTLAESRSSIIEITSLAGRAMFGFPGMAIVQIALSVIYFY